MQIDRPIALVFRCALAPEFQPGGEEEISAEGAARRWPAV